MGEEGIEEFDDETAAAAPQDVQVISIIDEIHQQMWNNPRLRARLDRAVETARAHTPFTKEHSHEDSESISSDDPRGAITGLTRRQLRVVWALRSGRPLPHD